MLSHCSFTQNPLIGSISLPFSCISLEDWVLVSIHGDDRRKFLQGQLTNDIRVLTENSLQFSAHCDAKGNVQGYLYLFASADDTLYYLVRRQLVDHQLNLLKKYSIFSKVTFTLDTDHVLLGFAGKNCRQYLQSIYQKLPDPEMSVIHIEQTHLLYLPYPQERFIAVFAATEADNLINELKKQQVFFNNNSQWDLLDIEAGYPIITEINSDKFLPQSFNLQAVKAISFKKGCYVGQEMVAKAEYRGINKRALFYLSGHSQQVPEIGEPLEIRVNDHWKKTGTVLAALRLADDTISVQAILNKEVNNQDVFRISQDEQSKLIIQPLPYTLPAE